MKFRFNKNDFYRAFPGKSYENSHELCFKAARLANSLLEAHEATLQKVSCLNDSGLWVSYESHGLASRAHTALLWNLEETGE